MTDNKNPDISGKFKLEICFTDVKPPKPPPPPPQLQQSLTLKYYPELRDFILRAYKLKLLKFETWVDGDKYNEVFTTDVPPPKPKPKAVKKKIGVKKKVLKKKK